jgi:hypothetical protein
MTKGWLMASRWGAGQVPAAEQQPDKPTQPGSVTGPTSGETPDDLAGFILGGATHDPGAGITHLEGMAGNLELVTVRDSKGLHGRASWVRATPDHTPRMAREIPARWKRNRLHREG